MASGILKSKKNFSIYLFKRTQTENKMLKDTVVFYSCVHLGRVQQRQWETGGLITAFWRG